MVRRLVEGAASRAGMKVLPAVRQGQRRSGLPGGYSREIACTTRSRR